jgi:hypothetical protein
MPLGPAQALNPSAIGFMMPIPEASAEAEHCRLLRLESHFHQKGLGTTAILHPFRVLMKIDDVIWSRCRVKNVETARISYSGEDSTRQKLYKKLE